MCDLPQVALAVLWYDQCLVLQLRDFDSRIADPGQWGFFGGHVREGELPDDALRRELVEELGWRPLSVEPLGSFADDARKRIFGYSVDLDVPLTALQVNEGQELGVFSKTALAEGTAYSQRWKRTFPLTPISVSALKRWVGLPSIHRRQLTKTRNTTI